MALNERDRRALHLGALGLGAVAAYLGLIEPALNTYDAVALAHEQQAASVSRHVSDRQRDRYYDGRIAEWERENGKLSPPRPYSEQITTVSEQVVTASQGNGTQVRNSSWSAAMPWGDEAGVALATLHLEAEADWENVFKFVAALYRIEGVLSVEQIDMSSDPKKGGKVDLRLDVSVMVQPQEQGRGA